MGRIELLAEGVTLFLGDCREILPTIGAVDAIVTSPPYAQQRDYGQQIGDWTALVSSLANIPSHEKTLILVNLGLIYRDGELVEYWDDFKRNMRTEGWKLFGWYVWDKGFGIPAGDQNRRLSTAHEWVFHFNRNARDLNKWVRTKDRLIPGKGIRQADGSMKGITSPANVGQPFKIPDSVIRLPPHQLRGGIENEHPAIFPVALPDHLIRTATDVGQTVCDPFMGSGTTGVAAVKIGRKFLGIEIEQKYFDIACRRISDALSRPDMFIERPKPTKQESML